MNGICSAEFGRRYATRFCFCGCQTRAEARGYARLPLSRQELSALADDERSPARLPLSRLELSALANDERSPARLPLSRLELSALADDKRSPVISSPGFGGKWIRRRVATVEPKGIASNSMNSICSAEFGRRYATRFCFCACQTRAEARGYARLPLSRQELSALADGERSPAIHCRVSVENGSVVASRRLNRKASHRIR